MARRNRVVILVILFLAIQFLILAKAHAEYRVFRLGIQYEPGAEEVEVLSTLDNLQYRSYYQLTPTQSTRLIAHWMCWGRTDDMLPLCEEPPKALPTQSLATP